MRTLIPFQRNTARRGFALLLVISVLALIALYILAAEGVVSASHSMRLIYGARMERTEGAARVVAQLAHAGGSDAIAAAMPTVMGLPARQVTGERRALGGDDPVWKELPGLGAKPGDALVTVRFSDGPPARRVERYLVNTAGQRHGVIELGALEVDSKAADSITSTSTTAQKI